MPRNCAKATRPFHKRIVIAFDFDRTLSDGTIDALLDELGVEDHMAWRRDKLAPMVEEGWDEILAKGVLLARVAEDCGREITRDLVWEVGRRLPSYPGVEEMAARLREIGREVADAEVELYVLSSGFVDMMTVSPIAHLFDDIWGSSMHWEDGSLAGVKRSLIQENGGIGLAVDHSEDAEQWQAAEHIYRSARVENLAPPDFSEGAELRRSLELATKIIAHRVALRALAQGE